METFTKIKYWLITGFVVVIGVALLIYAVIYSKSINGTAVNLYDANLDWTTLKTNEHIAVDADLTFGYYESVTEDGKETSRHYFLCDLKKNDDGWYFAHAIGVIANRTEDFRKWDRLADSTFALWTDSDFVWTEEPIHVDGLLRKMDDEEIGFARENLQNIGYTDEEIDSFLIPYVLVPDVKGNKSALFVGAAFCLGFGIFRVLYFLVKSGAVGKKTVSMQTVADNNSGFDSFNDAGSFDEER